MGREKKLQKGVDMGGHPCYSWQRQEGSSPTDKAEGARKETPMQHQSNAEREVVVKIKTTVTVTKTITITEANKKAACECCNHCKR